MKYEVVITEKLWSATGKLKPSVTFNHTYETIIEAEFYEIGRCNGILSFWKANGKVLVVYPAACWHKLTPLWEDPDIEPCGPDV